jgi:hypothetical protein
VPHDQPTYFQALPILLYRRTSLNHQRFLTHDWHNQVQRQGIVMRDLFKGNKQILPSVLAFFG